MSNDTHIYKLRSDLLQTLARFGVQLLCVTKRRRVSKSSLSLNDREKNFSSHRNDGSRLDKFRTLLSRSLTPIEMWGDIVTNATKTVRNLPILANSRWLTLIIEQPFPPSEVIFAAVRYLISV
jgi:hypothetical protein